MKREKSIKLLVTRTTEQVDENGLVVVDEVQEPLTVWPRHPLYSIFKVPGVRTFSPAKDPSVVVTLVERSL